MNAVAVNLIDSVDWESYPACSRLTKDSTAPEGWNFRDLPEHYMHPNNEPPLRTSCAFEDPVRSGARSVRFQLNDGDEPVSLGTRAEVKQNTGEPSSDHERWYGFSIFLPPDFVRDQSAEILTQWHQADDTEERFGGSPPLAIQTCGGDWTVTVREDSWDNIICKNTKHLWRGAYETGRWTDWVVHVVWSAGPEGRLEVFRDRQRVCSREGQNKFDDGFGNYMKFGIYKWCWNPTPPPRCRDFPAQTDQRVVYYDELQIGDEHAGYDVVAPKGPVLSDHDVLLHHARAIFSWETDVPADSQVRYGTTSEMTKISKHDPRPVLSHLQAVGNLFSETTYYYELRSRTADGLSTVRGRFVTTDDV